MELSQIGNALEAYFDALPNARLVFLFGSAAKEKLGPESDVAVAIQFQEVMGTRKGRKLDPDQ
jgi:predicted nucleotidyltransferase